MIDNVSVLVTNALNNFPEIKSAEAALVAAEYCGYIGASRMRSQPDCISAASRSAMLRVP